MLDRAAEGNARADPSCEYMGHSCGHAHAHRCVRETPFSLPLRGWVRRCPRSPCFHLWLVTRRWLRCPNTPPFRVVPNCFARKQNRWRAATDRKRLTHAAEEEEDPSADELSESGGAGEGEGEAPPGAMPTGGARGRARWCGHSSS